MSTEELQFRTAAFGGFHKQDVLAYLERAGREHAERMEALQKELEEAKSARDALEEEKSAGGRERAELSGQLEACSRDLEAARRDREAVERRRAELERELSEVKARLAKAEPSAEAYERIKNRTAGVELDAHRRAQEIEDEAREKTKQARAELEQWIYKVQAGYDRLRTDVDATISHASGELERVRKSLDGLVGQFSEGDEALAALLHTYESAVGPKAPEPLPLKED